MFNTVSEISKWTHQIWTLLIKLSQDQLIWAAPHSIYSFVSLIYNNCSLIYSGIQIFDPLLILYVCLLTNKWSVYSFNGRFIWTVREKIQKNSTKKWLIDLHFNEWNKYLILYQSSRLKRSNQGTLLPYHGCSTRNDMTQRLKVVPS